MNSDNILHSSENNEWYTPLEYIELVYAVMVTIDLDPASSEKANEIVDAEKIYTIETDGLAHQDEWEGRVFLNPPYGKTARKSNQDIWTSALLRAYHKGLVKEAIALVNAVPDRNWFKPLWDFPICFCYDRIKFLDENLVPQTSPTHPNAFVYLPSHYDEELATEDFFAKFSSIGHVVFPGTPLGMS